MLVYRWTKATSQKLECPRVGSDSLHLQFKLTIWALSWQRKHINCTTRFKNVIFRHNYIMQKNSSYIETEQCYLFRGTHFNRQNVMLITPRNGQATAYGTYWKYLAEYWRIVWDVPRNVFLKFWWRQAAISQRPNYISCRGGWGEHSSQRALRRFTQWPWIEHSSLRLRRTGHRRPNEKFVANA